MLRASWNGRSGQLEICRGTTLAINYMSKFCGKKKPVPIGMGHQPNSYFALFKEDDVDFEISIDNTECKFRDVAFDLDINDDAIYPFLQPQNSSGTVHVVNSNGQKLHFRGRRRQSTSEDDGQDSPFREKPLQEEVEEPEIMVNRIKFTVQYSQMKSPQFQIFIKTKMKKIVVDAQPTMTVDELKELIMDKKKIPAGIQMMLKFGDNLLDDNLRTLQDYSIGHESMVHLVWKICEDSQKQNGLLQKNQQHSESGVVVVNDEKNCVQNKNKLQTAPFDPDESIKVEPFVIEMRLSRTYPVISS